MFRSKTLTVLLAAAALASAGCGDDNDNLPTNPTPPQQVSQTFDGTLTPFSARIHDFLVDNPGQVNAELSAMEPHNPDSPIVVGLDLGTWTGTSCQVSVSRTNIVVGQAIAGTATSVGNLCVRIYDVSPTGLAAPISYLITVRHF